MITLLKFKEEKMIDKEYIIFQPDVTEEEFFEFATEDTNCELIDGVLVIHSPASEIHEDIFSFLLTIIKTYFNETKKGKVYGSRFVMRLSKKWNPEPDLLLIAPDKYKNIKNGYLDGPADVVFEILSPATKEIDITKKVPEYLKAGVKEIVIIDPENELIILKRSEFTKSYSIKSNTIIELHTFPDLKINVDWIWNRNESSIYEINKELLKK